MKLSSDMLFAHPVLAPISTDYTGANFAATFEYTIDEDANLDINATLMVDCPALNRLLSSGGAGSGFFLICPRTYENRLLRMAPGSRLHRLRASDFFGTVLLRPVIWSTQEHPNWRSEQLHSEYGSAVNLPEASILALGEEQRFSIDRERLRPFESVFVLAAQDDLPPGEIVVDADAPKITIRAHTQTKQSIEGIRNSVAGRSILLSSVYQPAIMQVLSEVARDRGRFEGRPWFRIFEAKAAAAGITLDSPELLRDAQRLLNRPFLKVEAEKERLFT